MSSDEADTQSSQNSGSSIFIPIVLGLVAASPPPSQEGQNRTSIGGLVLINPIARSMMMIRGLGNLDQLSKEGPLPASKAATEAMPAVKVTEKGVECVICLGELEVGGVAKEMPCKHRYHSGCIVKWLGIHGSCPVCRYKMPVEEEGDDKKGGGDGGGGGGGDGENGGRRGEMAITSSFSFLGGGDSSDSNSNSNSDSDDDSMNSQQSDDDGGETDDGLSIEDMEFD